MSRTVSRSTLHRASMVADPQFLSNIEIKEKLGTGNFGKNS